MAEQKTHDNPKNKIIAKCHEIYGRIPMFSQVRENNVWKSSIELPNGMVFFGEGPTKVNADFESSKSALEFINEHPGDFPSQQQPNLSIQFNVTDSDDEVEDERLDAAFSSINHFIKSGISCEVRFDANIDGTLSNFYMGTRQ